VGYRLVDRAEYEKLAEVEEGMWWFRGLHANLVAAVPKGLPAGPLLDAGCGTGGLLKRLGAAFPERPVLGLDYDGFACALAQRRSGAPVCRGSVNDLPFADASLAAILSADVLCHAGVDEARALGEFRRCLKPGGALVLNLPAYPWLLSDHDLAVDNVRRYTRARVLHLLREAGFASARCVHWNWVLFPAMVLRRLAAKGGGSDVKPFPAPVEAACRAVMALETRILHAGLAPPFGGSILAVAEKHA
jgi:SAM-dependent methyltransferase